MTQTTLSTETQRPSLPEYFERFVQHVWPNKPQHWEALTWELIEAGSDGRGNKYALETARNLIASREAGKQPEELGYFGSYEPPHERNGKPCISARMTRRPNLSSTPSARSTDWVAPPSFATQLTT